MKLAETLGSGQGRNYTPINRCVAFSEGPCRGLDAHSGMASIPIQGALRSPCAGFASYPHSTNLQKIRRFHLYGLKRLRYNIPIKKVKEIRGL